MSRIFVIIGLVLFTGLGCQLMNLSNLKEPTVQIESIEVGAIDFEGIEVNVLGKVTNPNDKDIKVDEWFYKVYLNDTLITDFKDEEGLELMALEETPLQLPLRLEYSRLGSALQEFLSKKEATMKIEGALKSGWIRVPFKKEEKISL